MNELITISQTEIDDHAVQTINARDLHSFLGIRKDFSNWIKKQIDRARLVENRDYVTYAQKGVGGKFDSIEYYLTLESGKHIAMLSGTEKGFEVREYFIECEQVARQPVDPMKALNDPAAMRGLLLTYTEKVLALEEEKKVMAPKVDAFDRISNADGLTCITDTAKSLQMRPKDLFAWLSANQWIYRRAGGKGWLAYQLRQQQGLLFHKVTTVALSDGREKMSERVLVTPKGLTKLANAFSLEATS